MILPQLLVICTVAIAAVTAQQKKIEVSTRYITTSITTLGQGETKTFIGSLCKKFGGQTVNATVLLNNNPTWKPLIGVVYYYIVDDAGKTAKDALCNNTNQKTGIAGPSCTVQNWPGSGGDLYMKVRNGGVAAVSFSIDVDITPNKQSRNSKNHRVKQNNVAIYKTPSNVTIKAGDEYLTEIVEASTNQRLPRQEEALLEVTYCPNSFTTDTYKITSTVFGTDGTSSYAQYICVNLPCEVDNPNILPQSNGNQLPNNNVVLTTSSGQFAHIYVLIVCWDGDYDPAVGKYVGEFEYSGSLTRIP